MAVADVLDPLRELMPSEKAPVPSSVRARIDRGRNRMKEGANLRNECLNFWRGNQYVFRNSNGYLVKQETAPGSSKPNHRIRQVRNALIDVVAQEVSAATQRIPAYEINPSTSDPEDVNASRLAGKVARYGYDKWRIREAMESAVTLAVVADEAFVWPYFDTSIGQRITDNLHTGEIVLRVFSANEVYWEPGVPFNESRWHAVEQARSLDAVYAMRGYVGGKLKGDASSSDVLNDRKVGEHMVMVTEYLERPSASNPQGRRLIFANDRLIVPEESYPCVDPKGEFVDEPVLHKVSYFIDPASDRDMGLVRHCLDAQRTINDSTNKALEWKNLALAPQMLAPVGSLQQRITDEPGAVFEYIPVGGQVPQWRPTPAIPRELFEISDRAKNDIQSIAGQMLPPAGVEAGRALAVWNEQMANRRQAFIARLAEAHSRIMRHCLFLVARHYSEPRLLKIRGRYGPETVRDFLGSHLRGQADVTVLPGSIEPRTRAAMEQKVMSFIQLGAISPQEGWAAINGGTAENLVQSYELDLARANLVVQKIKSIQDGSTEVPMPRKFDNIAVHRSVVQDFAKTSDFDSSPEEVQRATMLYLEALDSFEAQQQAEEARKKAEQAAALGMQNATKPPGVDSLPSLPAGAPSQNGAAGAAPVPLAA